MVWVVEGGRIHMFGLEVLVFLFISFLFIFNGKKPFAAYIFQIGPHHPSTKIRGVSCFAKEEIGGLVTLMQGPSRHFCL